MDRRRLGILAAVLIVLIATGAWLRARERTVFSGPTSVPLIPPTLDLGGLTAVDLSVGSTENPQIQLTKDSSSGQWKVATAFDAPADLERLNRLVRSLRGLSGEERARDKRWFSDFGVGEEGLELHLRQADRTVGRLVIGRSRKDPTTHFVRLKDGEVVYSTEENLLGEMGLWGSRLPETLSSQDWVDLRLFPVTVDQVDSLEVAEWVNGSWVVRGERHEPLDGDAQSVVSSAVYTRATAVVDPASQAAAFGEPRWRWILLQQDGTRLELEEAPAPKEAKEDKGTQQEAKELASLTARRPPNGPYFTISPSALSYLREQLLPKGSTSEVTAPSEEKVKPAKKGKPKR